MFINKGLDNENTVNIHHEYYAAIKKKEIMTSAATCMQLEAIITRKINTGTENQIQHVNTYKWELNNEYS